MDQQEHSLLLSVPSMDLMLRSSIVMRLSTSKKVNYRYLKNHKINSNFMFVFVCAKLSDYQLTYVSIRVHCCNSY